MVKWIVMLACTLTLAACGSMSMPGTSSSGYGDQSYSSGPGEAVNLAPSSLGDGTLGVPGP